MDKDLEAAGAAPTLRPLSFTFRGVSMPPPPPPPKDEGYRPNTASTKRLSYSTTVSTSQKTIKYATWGRFAGTELSPQPSDDPEDPLVSLLLIRVSEDRVAALRWIFEVVGCGRRIEVVGWFGLLGIFQLC